MRLAPGKVQEVLQFPAELKIYFRFLRSMFLSVFPAPSKPPSMARARGGAATSRMVSGALALALHGYRSRLAEVHRYQSRKASWDTKVTLLQTVLARQTLKAIQNGGCKRPPKKPQVHYRRAIGTDESALLLSTMGNQTISRPHASSVCDRLEKK